MPFSLRQTSEAAAQLALLARQKSKAKRFSAVSKCLRLLASNPRHPGLNTHEYSSSRGPSGKKVFEAYAENRTSAAYRGFWHDGPGPSEITIIAITPHP